HHDPERRSRTGRGGGGRCRPARAPGPCASGSDRMTDFTATETRVSAAGFDLGAAGVTPPSNPNRRGVFLADVVVELGLADQETIEQAQQTAQETEKTLERYLLESGILDGDSLARAIAERNGLDHVDLDEFEVDMEAARMVARSAAERYR